MKYLTIILYTFICLNGNSQEYFLNPLDGVKTEIGSTKQIKNELQFNYRFGYPTQNLKVISQYAGSNINEYQNNKVRALYDQGLTLNFKRQIWKKIHLYANVGLELSQSKHYFPLMDPSFRLLENININSNRVGLYFGLNKQIHLYSSKVILDLGIQFVDRYYLKNEVNYQTDFHTTVQDWIQLKYELNTYYGDYYKNDGTIENIPSFYLNLDYNATLKFNLKKNLYLNFGLNYSRNNHFFYDLKYTVNYYYNGSTTPETYEYLGLSGSGNPKFPVKNHYIYLNTGITFKF